MLLKKNTAKLKILNIRNQTAKVVSACYFLQVLQEDMGSFQAYIFSVNSENSSQICKQKQEGCTLQRICINASIYNSSY